MESIARYRKKISQDKNEARNSPFIERALNKVSINKYVRGDALDVDYDAVLVFKDKEGPDAGILYTYEKDGLEVGDTIVKKGVRSENNVYYIIIEEVKRVDTSVTIKVFNVLEANVLFRTKNSPEMRPAYLQSNLRLNVRSSDRGGSSLELKKGVLVAPKTYGVRLDDKINVQNLMTGEVSYASWLVEGVDDVSTPKINYMHLGQVLKEEFTDSPQGFITEGVYTKAFEAIELATIGGHVKVTPDAKVLERSETRVVVQVPKIEGLLTIEVKSANGIVEKEYIVRG